MVEEMILKSVEISNGETIGYRECGKGEKTLVLVHGNMTSSKHWDVLIERLMDTYKIYAVDLRGFGISSYNRPINSLKDLSEDIKLFADALGLKGFSMAGWSTGGGVVLQFAADYPDYVEKLIMVESVGITGYPMFKKDEKGQPILGEFLRTKEDVANDAIQVKPILYAYETKNKALLQAVWNAVIYSHNKPSDEKYEEYLEDMLTQRNLVDVDYALLTFNMSNTHNGVVQGSGDINKVTAPTLVLQGDRDYVVPMTMAQSIVEGLGEKARLVLLENSGHSPLIDCLDRLVAEFKAFI